MKSKAELIKKLKEIEKRFNKEDFEKRFKELYQNKRLLAVQFNGFSHCIYYDEGTKETPIQKDEYSSYAPEIAWKEEAKKLLGNIGHLNYQHNPKEYVFVSPEDR